MGIVEGVNVTGQGGLVGILVSLVVGQIVLFYNGVIVTRKTHNERLADRDLLTEFWRQEALARQRTIDRLLGTAEVTNKVLDATAEVIAAPREVSNDPQVT